MRLIPLLSTLLLTATTIAAQAGEPGFQYINIPDAAGSVSAAQQSTHPRPLEAVIWYPADPGDRKEIVGENPVLFGQTVDIGAPPAPGRHPLVLLSHGYGGNWSNQAWLAVALVQAGYVVAAVNHPGTTTRNRDAATGAQIWERPRDLTRLLDRLEADPTWSAMIAGMPVAAIGHSFGGWTVMELAGARFDPDRLEADCAAHPGLAACSVYRELGAGKTEAARSAMRASWRDPRIAAVVSLDLGLSRGFTPESLAAISVPTLVMAAGAPNAALPAAMESHAMAAQMNGAITQGTDLPPASHFSFLPVCKPGAEALLADEPPEDRVACRDGAGGDRATLHAQATAAILSFLAKALDRR